MHKKPQLQKLAIFVSSTIRDMTRERSAIYKFLKKRAIDIRMSEFNDGLVITEGEHNQDIGLNNIPGCAFFILLIGDRFGGGYKNSDISVTWREWEEARMLHVPTIVFIRSEVDKKHKRYQDNPECRLPKDFDRRILQLIDAVREERFSNWIYSKWERKDGIPYLLSTIQHRLNHAAVEASHLRDKLSLNVTRQEEQIKLAQLVLEYCSNPKNLQNFERDVLQPTLDWIADHRSEFFGFTSAERYNFAIYLKNGRYLEPVARTAHCGIERRNRRWRLDEGRIGECYQRCKIIISPEMPKDSLWIGDATDEQFYGSSLCAPIQISIGRKSYVRGVFIVSSNKKRLFVEENFNAIWTTKYIVYLIEMAFSIKKN